MTEETIPERRRRMQLSELKQLRRLLKAGHLTKKEIAHRMAISVNTLNKRLRQLEEMDNDLSS